MKKCGKCNKIKSRVEFYTQKRPSRNGKIYYGYRYMCKPCEHKATFERRKAGGWISEKKRQVQGTKHSKQSKINSQRHRNEMSPMYIRSLMTKKSKTLRSEDIPDEMVELYRLNLKIKRKLTLRLKEGED